MSERDVQSTLDSHTASDVDPPSIDSDGVPDRCLSLTIESDWGHFRRIDRTVTKQTYRLPPRTTVAGILAAISGVSRDGYYDTFGRNVSAIAIEPLTEIRTITEPSLGLGTDSPDTTDTAGGTGRNTLQVEYPDSTDNRQIHSYELLVQPAYRIDVAVEDREFYNTLRHRLETGTSYYPPSMGLSEFLAWIEFHGEHSVDQSKQTGATTVDSAVPGGVEEAVPSVGTNYVVERVPGFMEVHENGRRTTGYVDYALSPDVDEGVELTANDVTPATVDDRTVVFC